MQKDGFWILFSENQQQQHQLSALQIKVDANMESLARLAFFLNGPSQVHIVVQFSFFIYLFCKCFLRVLNLPPFLCSLPKNMTNF